MGSVAVKSGLDARNFGNCFNEDDFRFPASDLNSTNYFASGRYGPDFYRTLSSAGSRYLPEDELRIKSWIDQRVLASWENEDYWEPVWDWDRDDLDDEAEEEFKFVEPMVFDLVRGLGAKPGESEVNYLMIIPLNGDQVKAASSLDPIL